MDDIQRPSSLVCKYSTCKASLCSLARQSLPYRESPQLSRDKHEHPSKECCLQLQRRPMHDIQRPSSLVAGIACSKHLYVPWHGNRCPIEKVLNFPETSMSIQVKSVVYSSSACAKHLYVPWHGNCCLIEKVLNFPETSMSIQVKSVVYSSKVGLWMIFRGQNPWLQVKHVQSNSMFLGTAIAAL
jgi:hypothetical protein